MGTFVMRSLLPLLEIDGSDLLMRVYGELAFPILERALLGTSVGYALVLDFDGVSVMDASFADASVLELAIGLAAGAYDDRYIVLRATSPTTVFNLEGAIARRKAKVAMLVDGRECTVIGHLERNLAEAWQLVIRDGSMTARQLADRLRLEISAASMRLRKLYDARVVTRREEIGLQGRLHVYTLPA